MAALAAACVVYISAARAQEPTMALPRVSVACVREEPRHSAELGTQVVMGTPVKITGDTENGWPSRLRKDIMAT